jgi:hypothetical protein
MRAQYRCALGFAAPFSLEATEFSRSMIHRQAVGRTKDDVRPLHMFEWAVAIRDDGQQTLTIFGGRKDTDGLSHAHRLARPPEFVNHPSVSVH